MNAIEAKLRQAEEQLAFWRQKAEEAQRQALEWLIHWRWQMKKVATACLTAVPGLPRRQISRIWILYVKAARNF